MHRRFLLLLTVLLASCAAHGDLFQKLEPPAADQAVLYIFRTQYVPRNMDLAPGISVNGTEVGALPLDGYLRVQVPPGATEVGLVKRAYLWPVGAPLRTIRVETKAGGTHFVEFSVENYRIEKRGLETRNYIGIDLRSVSEESAMRFLPKLKNVN